MTGSITRPIVMDLSLAGTLEHPRRVVPPFLSFPVIPCHPLGIPKVLLAFRALILPDGTFSQLLCEAFMTPNGTLMGFFTLGLVLGMEPVPP